MRNKILSVYKYYIIVIIFLLVSFSKELQANLSFRHIGFNDMTELEARSHAMQYYTKFKLRLLLDQEKEMKDQKQSEKQPKKKFYKMPISSCLLYTSTSPRDQRQTRMPS